MIVYESIFFENSAGSMAFNIKEKLGSFWNNVNRKKTITDDFHDTPLKKCLSTFDMTLLGVGQMVGAGLYVLTGKRRLILCL